LSTQRIFIHVAGLGIGMAVALVLAQMLNSNSELPSALVVVLMTLVIFISQVLSFLLAERISRPAADPTPAVVLPRGPQSWGWLKPISIGDHSAGFPLSKETILIGRGVEMDITLNNASISRQHAELTQLVDGVMLRDNGSRNGVFVNNKRITEQLLQDGDEVKFGEVKFKFVRVYDRRRGAPDPRAEPVERRTAEEPEAAPAVEVVEEERATDKAPQLPASALPREGARPFDETADYSNE
jgi:hypothetical protein